MGYIDTFSPQMWMTVFAAVSLLVLVSYALGGLKQWGLLFPAGVFGGLAMVITLAEANVDSAAIASPLFFGLLIPFLAAYLTDRIHNWWALIPGGVMLFLALTTLLVDSAGGEWVGALFLFMIALSFFFVYLNDRTRTWAVLVAYIIGVLGIAPLMSMGGRDAAYFGPIFLFAVALPFFYVYFRFPENWWAIIPAGSVTVVAIIAAAAIAGFINAWRARRIFQRRNCQRHPHGRTCRYVRCPLGATRQAVGKDRDHCSWADGRGFRVLCHILPDPLACGDHPGRHLFVLYCPAIQSSLTFHLTTLSIWIVETPPTMGEFFFAFPIIHTARST